MKHTQFTDLLFMFFSSLAVVLLITAIIYTTRAVMSDVASQGPENKTVLQQVVYQYTDLNAQPENGLAVDMEE